MYNVIIGKKVGKTLDRLPDEYYQLIIKHLLDLENNPRPFGCIKLTGSQNSYRIRVGVYRIIYTIKDDVLTVEVIKIDHRKDVYRSEP
jgi:mRNA interferase RelE/StbE